MSKEENVVKYYAICNRLKNVIRKGWKLWNVQRDRLESVAEHIFSTQMLAIAMKHEYQYDVDIMKVVFMLAIHELGEAIIDDLTQFEIKKSDKEKIEHAAVHEILSGILDGEQIEELFLEFDSHSTKEGFYAWQCDKLDCDLQSKIYDEEGCVDLTKQDGNFVMNNSIVKRLLDNGESWSTMWLKYGQEMYPYDDNFKAVSNYAIKNKINK